MVHGVVADDVSFVKHPLDQLGLFLDVLTGEEEQAGSFLFLEGIEDFRSGAVFIAAVEGEVADLFLGIALVDAAVLVEDFDGFIPSVPLDVDFSRCQVAHQLAGVPVSGFQIAVGEVNAPYGIQIGEGCKTAVIPRRETVDVFSVHEVPVFAVPEAFAGGYGTCGGLGIGCGFIGGGVGAFGFGGSSVGIGFGHFTAHTCGFGHFRGFSSAASGQKEGREKDGSEEAVFRFLFHDITTFPILRLIIVYILSYYTGFVNSVFAGQRSFCAEIPEDGIGEGKNRS